MTTPRVRNRIQRVPLTCGRCGGFCPAEFRICDACTDPEHARRRAAGVARRSPEERVEAASLSEYSARIDAAITSLEKHAQRALKLAIDADAGVTPLRATKRPHATAIAGASTGNEEESLR